jgi:hypothetical protein
MSIFNTFLRDMGYRGNKMFIMWRIWRQEHLQTMVQFEPITKYMLGVRCKQNRGLMSSKENGGTS